MNLSPSVRRCLTKDCEVMVIDKASTSWLKYILKYWNELRSGSNLRPTHPEGFFSILVMRPPLPNSRRYMKNTEDPYQSWPNANANRARSPPSSPLLTSYTRTRNVANVFAVIATPSARTLRCILRLVIALYNTVRQLYDKANKKDSHIHTYYALALLTVP